MLEVPKLHFRRSDAFPKDTASAAESRVCTQRRCSSQGAPLPEDGEGAGAWSPEECPMEKQSGFVPWLPWAHVLHGFEESPSARCPHL